MSAATQRAGGRERAAPPSRGRTPGRGGPERPPARAPAAPALRQAGNQAVQRMMRPDAAPAISASPAAALQRCGCGGGAAPLADPLLQRQAAGPAPAAEAPASAVPPDAGRPLDPGTRAFMEERFGRDLGDVRIHTGPAADDAARGLNARAFTVGQDVVFGAGEYDPGSPGGRRLLAHELTHTVQQGGAAPPGPGQTLPVSRPDDALEREAERVAERVLGGVPAAPVSPARPGVQRQILPDVDLPDLPDVPSWEDIKEGAAETWEDTKEAAGEAAEWAGETASDLAEGAGEVIDTVMGFPRAVWDQAQALARALKGVVTISGTSLVINVPRLPACPRFALQFSLPEIGVDIPILMGAIPIHPAVQIYGMVGLHLGAIPEISAQIGPCELHGLSIVINPLGPSVSAAGSLTATLGLGLGAELRAALKGEVGVRILWPKPPLILEIPVASVEAGLAGFARGIVLSQITVGGAMTASLSGVSLVAFKSEDMGLALDLGLAGYGALQLLGMNLCTLYWPLWSWHGDATLSSSLLLTASAGTGGVSASLTVNPPQLNAVPFSSLPLDIPRGMFADDCPLCDAFYAMGLMPSQRGGGWNGHPTPPWFGPLHVYPRDPGIASGAKCRGACGPDCDTCSPPVDLVVCEETPDGRHYFWIYPNYQECGSAGGCRQHDGSYDWCAAGGESSILGPCHRVADFECICNYGAPQCVGWIFGSPPHDSVMAFSDAPYVSGFCVGPCPEATVTPEGETQYRLCLPDIPLVDRTELFNESWSESTGEIPLYETVIVIPVGKLPVPVLVEVVAQGDLLGGVSAAVGPVWLSGICLDVDPVHGIYAGHAELHAQAGAQGFLSITGSLTARAGWGCLLSVVDGTAGLTGRGTLSLDTELIDQVDVSCRAGEIVLDNTAWLSTCLDVLLGLDAHLQVRVFGFPVLSETWTLLEREWGECWDVDLGVTSIPLGGGALIDFDAEDPDARSLLEWMLRSAIDDRQLLDRITGSSSPGAPAPALSSAAPGAGGGGLSIPANPAAASGTPDPCATPAPTPTGLTEDDPIPMRWFKEERTDHYPSPITVAGIEYDHDDGSATLPLGEPIGVPRGFWPRVGKTFQLLAEERGDAADDFRETLRNRYGFSWAGLQADHVQDLQWSGPDAWRNIWPYDSGANMSAGPRQNQHQQVTFAINPGGPPVTMSVQQMKNAGHFGRWFIIREVRF